LVVTFRTQLDTVQYHLSGNEVRLTIHQRPQNERLAVKPLFQLRILSTDALTTIC